MRRLLITLMLMAIGAWWSPIGAQQESTRVLLVLDCSARMQEQWQSGAKIKVVQQVLGRFLDSIAKYPDSEVALRLFGQGTMGTRLEVPFEPGSSAKVQRKMKTLVPDGEGKASVALLASRDDFPRGGLSRNIVVVITDREEQGMGQLCGLARQLQQSGDVLQAYVLCIDADGRTARDGCDNTVVYMREESQLDAALSSIFKQVHQKSWVMLNVVGEGNVPYEADIPVAFYDHKTHAVKKAFVYHYGMAERVDTLEVDPFVSYDITLFTKPPVTLTERQFPAEQRQTVTVEAAQGDLQLTFSGKKTVWTVPEYQILIRPHAEKEVLSKQPLNAKCSYLTGHYDIEVLTVPPTRIDDVELKAGTLTALQMDAPGLLVLNKPRAIAVGSLFVSEGGTLWWVCDLNPNQFSERLILMPGEYQVILRPKEQTGYDDSRTTRFTITSAQQTTITMEP